MPILIPWLPVICLKMSHKMPTMRAFLSTSHICESSAIVGDEQATRIQRWTWLRIEECNSGITQRSTDQDFQVFLLSSSDTEYFHQLNKSGQDFNSSFIQEYWLCEGTSQDSHWNSQGESELFLWSSIADLSWQEFHRLQYCLRHSSEELPFLGEDWYYLEIRLTRMGTRTQEMRTICFYPFTCQESEERPW